jgi:hypothetical protein
LGDSKVSVTHVRICMRIRNSIVLFLPVNVSIHTLRAIRLISTRAQITSQVVEAVILAEPSVQLVSHVYDCRTLAMSVSAMALTSLPESMRDPARESATGLL